MNSPEKRVVLGDTHAHAGGVCVACRPVVPIALKPPRLLRTHVVTGTGIRAGTGQQKRHSGRLLFQGPQKGSRAAAPERMVLLMLVNPSKEPISPMPAAAKGPPT